MGPGTLLRDARHAAGLTQADLARRLGTSQPAVAKLEASSANPSIATLDGALRATGHRLQLFAPSSGPSIDESLLRRQLELTPGQRIASSEALYAAAREVALAGERGRGELA